MIKNMLSTKDGPKGTSSLLENIKKLSFASSFNRAANEADDILLMQNGKSYQLGFWKQGKNIWHGSNAVHTDEWLPLGLYDMDGDGHIDIPFVGVIRGESNKTFYIGFYKDGIDSAANWKNIGQVDVPNDETWSVVIGNVTGSGNCRSVIWFSAQSGKLGAWLDGTSQWVNIPGNFANWELVGCGDFEGTGVESIVMSYNHGARYYSVDIAGNLTELKNLGSDGRICGIGDLDGKGKDDILFVHEKIGVLTKWSMGELVNLGQLDTAEWQVLGCGRYSGGNGADVLVQNKSTGLVGFYAGGDLSKWHEIGVLGKEWKIIPGSGHRKTLIPKCRTDFFKEFFPFQSIKQNLPIVLMLLRNDIKAKFRHSVLGVLWLFIPPFLILLIYVYMFSFIFKMRWPDAGFSSRWGLGLFVYAGITVYSAFSDSIMGSLNLLPAHSGMVKRVPFPLELFPLSLANSNILISSVILWIIFLLSLITGGHGSWMAILYFPLIYLPYALFITGCSWITSALGVFFRDLGNLLGVILLLWLFACPVFYSEKMIPEQFSLILQYNPLSSIIRNIRCIFLQNSAPDAGGLLYSWIIGIVIFQLGFFFFQKQRRRFPDVI